MWDDVNTIIEDFQKEEKEYSIIQRKFDKLGIREMDHLRDFYYCLNDRQILQELLVQCGMD